MWKLFAVLAVSVASFLIFTAAPAQALAPANCPSGATCIWWDKDWKSFGRTWDLVGFQRDIPYYAQWYFNDGQAADNVASSMHNHGATTVYLFKGTRCSGYAFTKAPGGTDGNFANGDPIAPDGTSYNDQVSSGAFNSYVSSCRAS